MSALMSRLMGSGLWLHVCLLIAWSMVAVLAHLEWEVRGSLVLAWTLVVRKSGLTPGRPVWIWMFRLMLSDLDLSGQKPSELGCLV